MVITGPGVVGFDEGILGAAALRDFHPRAPGRGTIDDKGYHSARGGMIQNHRAAPMRATTLPRLMPHCQPACSLRPKCRLIQPLTSGVTTGAARPTAFPPVLQMPAAVPPRRPPSSTAVVQVGASVAPTAARASASHST